MKNIDKKKLKKIDKLKYAKKFTEEKNKEKSKGNGKESGKTSLIRLPVATSVHPFIVCCSFSITVMHSILLAIK